ncbi:hypothetical protein [Piscinibacter sp. HJYY11]|uniref:hypothetical protein n=1 Tax=Piscinibacter sp. HJYY11 TaxID=2801333 RepID=UPI00191FFCE7|nr:hypothetical protein [Piscinibacter sp. HJYY11]MBL0728459.1 hypothetical protein [Piscinibacter sp. HJYY11]
MQLSHLLRGRRAAWVLSFGLVGSMLTGCAPSLDWREIRPEDSDAIAMFPCKPTTDARMVNLAGARVRMVLVACRAGDATWALAFADVGDPAKVTPALLDLRASNAGNLNGTPAVTGQMRLAGMSPNPQAERVHVQGRLPAGDAVVLESGFFARGTRVYQATVMGKAIDADALAMFFDGLKLRT